MRHLTGTDIKAQGHNRTLKKLKNKSLFNCLHQNFSSDYFCYGSQIKHVKYQSHEDPWTSNIAPWEEIQRSCAGMIYSQIILIKPVRPNLSHSLMYVGNLWVKYHTPVNSSVTESCGSVLHYFTCALSPSLSFTHTHVHSHTHTDRICFLSY